MPGEGAARASGWLRRESAALRAPFARSALAVALRTLVFVAQAWLLAGILDAALFRHAPLAQMWQQWLALVALAPLRWWLSLCARRVPFDAALDRVVRLRAQLVARTQALGPIALRGIASGDVITRLVDGIDTLLPYYARYLPQTLTAAIVPLLLAAFVLPADWMSGLVLLLTAPLIPLFMVLLGGAGARASRERFAQLARLGASFVDALAGLVTLRQLGAAERVADDLATDGERYRVLTMQVLRVAFLSALVLEFFATVSIAIVAVLIGFRLLWHELAFRQGLFVLLLAPEIYMPLRALGALRHARMDALAAAGELARLEDVPAARTPVAGVRLQKSAPPAIRLQSVGYGHAGRIATLRDCSLELRPRCITALVGVSGVGKSTLIDLLLGFAVPTSGSIIVDGADLAGIDPASWRERIAWVPQHAHVFEGDVRDNLTLANPDADDAAIERAGNASGLGSVVARLPQGWKTRLGEHGRGLSGGELQRLALARAFLREQADVLLLDEPTAHLDAVSAARIDDAIRDLAAARTVLLVAHRLEAAQRADWIAVMRDGRIVEQGAPGELVSRRGAFADLLHAGAS